MIAKNKDPFEAFEIYYRETFEEEFNPGDIRQVVKREVFIAGYLSALGIKEDDFYGEES